MCPCCVTYDMCHVHLDCVPKIRTIAHKSIKEAAACTAVLGLQREFDEKEVRNIYMHGACVSDVRVTCVSSSDDRWMDSCTRLHLMYMSHITHHTSHSSSSLSSAPPATIWYGRTCKAIQSTMHDVSIWWQRVHPVWHSNR